MGIQIACLRKCLATLWTAEWFVTSVDYFMGLQIACLRECLTTLLTAKWFVNNVDFFHGSSDCFPARMFLATLWTAKWYVNSVDFFSLVFRLLACTNVSCHTLSS